MSFHWKDGWFFERLQNGSVHVYHEFYREAKPGTIQGVGVDTDIEIDADTWCSIIASMSISGETSETWQLANKFHKGNK